MTVGAQVFVAKATRDLEIAFEACDHEQLFHLLGRLRQRVEPAGMDAAGDDEVARAFGRAFEQDGRFDFEEVAIVEEIANEADDVVAQAQIRGQPGAAQIEVAVFETDGFVDLVALVSADDERRRTGLAENLQFRGDHFNFAGFQLRVFEAWGAFLYGAAYLDDVFAAHLGGCCERAGAIVAVAGCTGRVSAIGRIALRVIRNGDLRDARPVAQVEEDQAAVVAAAVDPAREGDLFSGVAGAQFATGMGLQHGRAP